MNDKEWEILKYVPTNQNIGQISQFKKFYSIIWEYKNTLDTCIKS